MGSIARKLQEMENLARKLRILFLRIASFIFIAFLLSGCSSITSFFIVNQSNSALEVSYQFSKVAILPDKCFDENLRPIPIVIPISALRKQDGQGQKLSQSEYSCNLKDLSVKFLVKPKMAVSIGTEVNYYVGNSFAYSHHLGIDSLKLSDNSGSITYEGSQVIKGFKKTDSTLYLVEYEGIGSGASDSETLVSQGF
jgi:uncharacterized protein YceK